MIPLSVSFTHVTDCWSSPFTCSALAIVSTTTRFSSWRKKIHIWDWRSGVNSQVYTGRSGRAKLRILKDLASKAVPQSRRRGPRCRSPLHPSAGQSWNLRLPLWKRPQDRSCRVRFLVEGLVSKYVWYDSYELDNYSES